MSGFSEAEWKKALTSILEELDSQQFRKLLEILDKIPKRQKEVSEEKMPRIIIEYYGPAGSVAAIDDAMEQIPRRDEKIQGQLQPFMEKLKAKEEEEKDGSKSETLDPQTEEERVIKTAGAVRRKSTMVDQPPAETPSWKKSIRDLKASNEIVPTDTIGGRVTHKFPLYTTKNKKMFFFVSVTDETASLELMVYGKPRYQEIKEGMYYSFRKIIRDKAGYVKVTSESIVAEISIFAIPEEVEKEAKQLCPKSPFYSIEEFKALDSGRGSVEGTVIEISSSKDVWVQNQKKTTKIQSFQIEDETDFIKVVFWGDKTLQCKKLCVGDVITLKNVNIHRYHNDVSLQSTQATNIKQVGKVSISNMKIEIVGIVKAQNTQIHLEVKLGQKIQTLIASSKLLAGAFGLTLGENFKRELKSALPLQAEARIEGNKIKEIKSIKN